MCPGGRGYIRTDFPHKDTIKESWTYGKERCRERGRKGNGRKDGRKEGREGGWEGGGGGGVGGRGREGGREGTVGSHHWVSAVMWNTSCDPVHNQMGTAPSEMQFRA